MEPRELQNIRRVQARIQNKDLFSNSRVREEAGSSIGSLGPISVCSPALELSGGSSFDPHVSRQITLTLNKQMAKYFSNKMGLPRNNKQLQFGIYNLMSHHAEVQRTKERNVFLQRKGEGQRGYCKQRVHWKKLGDQSLAFHWLSGNSLSLAEWLTGEEKILLLPAGAVEQKNIILLEMESICPFLFGTIDNAQQDMRTLPAGAPHSGLNQVFSLIFTTLFIPITIII